MNKHIWGVQMKKLSFKKTTAVAESMEKHAEQNLGSESGWLMDEQMSAVEELDDTGKEKKEQLKKDKIKKEKVKKEKIKKEKEILDEFEINAEILKGQLNKFICDINNEYCLGLVLTNL